MGYSMVRSSDRCVLWLCLEMGYSMVRSRDRCVLWLGQR